MDAVTTVAVVDAALEAVRLAWAACPNVEHPTARALLPAIEELNRTRQRLVVNAIIVTEEE